MKIALYARVSSTQQAQSQTIEEQLHRLHTHCQNQHWSEQDLVTFLDNGYSGASLKRPGLDRLRDAVARAEIDQILLTEPSRLARNYVHQSLLLEEFQGMGCQVIFLDRPMSQDPHDQLLLQIRGAVAEYERTLIAERMRRGRQQKLRAGAMSPCAHPPYGYRSDPNHPRDPHKWRLEETEAAHVAFLFDSYLQVGQSLSGVAKQVMSLGIKTPGLRENLASFLAATTADQSHLHRHAVCQSRTRDRAQAAPFPFAACRASGEFRSDASNRLD